MKASALAAASFFLLAGCMSRRPLYVSGPAQANFELIVREVVATPEEDEPVYAEVFVDGLPAGRAGPGPRSKEKIWRSNLEEGNRLLRFELWHSSAVPAAWPADYQPRERFIRVEPGFKTKVDLKFYDRSRQYDLDISREPR